MVCYRVNCTCTFIFTLLYRRSKQFWPFMRSEGSLPRSQQPNNCPYLKPEKSLPRPLYLFINIHFNNSAPPTSGSSNWSLSSRRHARDTPYHITIHFDRRTCRTIVMKFGVKSMPASCLSGIQTSQLMLYREIIAVCSQIHTKHINTLCGQNVE